MATVQMDVPSSLLPYLHCDSEMTKARQCAMLIYPYIRDGSLSYGKAAEILGLTKFGLISIYGSMGLPYFQETKEDIAKDLATLEKIRGRV